MFLRIQTYLVAFTPAVAWQVLTFFLSSRLVSAARTRRVLLFLNWLLGLGLATGTIEHLNNGLRKLAHLLLYMVFALLVIRGFRALPITVWRPGERKQWVWALAVVLCFAVLDEFHQSFVPDRSGRFSDVLLDLLGGTVGLTGLWLVNGRRRQAAVDSLKDSACAS